MDDSDDLVPPARLRVMQIVAGALISGATFFLVLVLFIVQVQNHGQGLAPAAVPVLSYFAVGLLAATTVASYIVPRRLVRQILPQIASGKRRPAPEEETADTSQLLALRQTSMLIALALHEGMAFSACVVYLNEGQPLALGVAGLAILFMLLRFPTRYRVQTWLRQQRDWLEKARERVDPPGVF